MALITGKVGSLIYLLFMTVTIFNNNMEIDVETSAQINPTGTLNLIA